MFLTIDNKNFTKMKISKRRKIYINKAIAVFKQDGLRISLDEVAGKMGITKKTLYNHFSSKDELLKECIQSISSDFQEAAKELDNKDRSAIENMRCAFSQINHFFDVLSPVFFYDIMRLNPNQAMSEHLVGSGLFQQKVELNLRQGIEEGVYRDDLNVEFVSRYMSYSIFGFYINSLVNHNPYISKSYFQDITTFTLRSLVSERAKHLL